MTNLSNDQKIKELELRLAAQTALGDLPSKARDILLDQIANTPAGRAHILGTAPAPSPRELVDALWAGSVGRDLSEVLAAKEAEGTQATTREAQLAEIAKLPPLQRITAARAAGLDF